MVHLSKKFSVIILAAGKGTRMCSDLPKVLHPVAGKPMLAHVLETARQLSPEAIYTVISHGSEQVKQVLADIHTEETEPPCHWVMQPEPLGTGHAVLQAIPLVHSEFVLVLYGDVPLLREETLRELMQTTPPESLGLLYTQIPDPTGLGRLLRNDSNQVIGIVEEKDATSAQRAIREIAVGTYWGPQKALANWLSQILPHNAQQEYYLPDIVPFAAKISAVNAVRVPEPIDTLGINDKQQLAMVERVYQQRQIERWMRAGVTVMDPARVDIRGEVTFGKNVTLDVNVILEGRVTIGDGCMIGPHTWIKDSNLHADVQVGSHCSIDGAILEAGAMVGPFARIRPGTMVGPHAKVGNFVELKKTHLGAKSKVNHLSYVGDTTVGEDVNIGAGTITCNYDGVHKHKTVIEDRAFIGSNTALVAPIVIGADALVGAGSVLTRDAPAGQLTLSRSPQKTVPRKKKVE